MLSDGVLNHAWDAENRLVCVSNAAAFATCAYDHSGRRVRRETFDPSTGAKLKTVTCAYDGWNLIRETSVAGPLAVPDIPAGGGAWTETRGDEIWVFSTVETEPDEWYFYHSAFHVTDDMGDTINVPETIGKLCDSNFEAPVPYPWYPSLGPNNIAPGAQWDVYGDRFYYGGVYDFTDDSGAPTGIIYLFANSLWPAPNWCEFLAADQLFPLNSDGSVPDFLPLAPGTPGVTAWIQSVPALVTNITRYPLAPGATNTVHYFWGSDLSGTLQGAGGVGGLIAVSIDGQYYFPCYDHNGNIMVYVSESGSVVAHYAYTPFGEVMSASGPMADAFRFRFSTKYQDAATGLYYYGYRFYDPVMMRFLNRDPIGEDGGLNLYGFVGNDPVNRWDYLGMVEGKYVLRDVPGIELNPIQAALAYAPDQLDGFEIEYIPEETCKCKKDTIRLVQALKIGWLGDPAIDTFPEVYKKHASTPGGIPLPGYTDSGGRAGNHGSLSYIDAPFDAVGDVFGGTAFYFETCALCSDETNLGCVTFSFNGKHRKISPSSGSEIKAAKPTRLWKGAEKRWQKAAGKKP